PTLSLRTSRTLLLFLIQLSPPPSSSLFPYTTLFRSAMNETLARLHNFDYVKLGLEDFGKPTAYVARQIARHTPSACRNPRVRARSEEHTSELQSLTNLVCRLLLEKKKTHPTNDPPTT